MLAFFGVIFAVNGYFLYAALSTHTGVVAVEPYRKGLAYNERIAADERQSDLGWRSEIALLPAGRIEVQLADRDGRPLEHRDVRVSVGRPATGQFDRTLQLTEAAPGRYVANTEAFGTGTWVAGLDARNQPDDDPVYRARRRLWLK
jgi:nitrogen fixation protein FixH